MSTLKKDVIIVVMAVAGALGAMKCNHHISANACKNKSGDLIVGCTPE